MKRKTKNTVTTIAITLVLAALLGWLTMGFQEFDLKTRFEKERNPDNLIKIADVTLKTSRHESGLDIEVDDEGVVTLNGTVNADVQLTYATVALAADDYILSGAEEGSVSTYYLSTVVGENTVRGDWPGEVEITTQGTYTIYINIEAETELKNIKLYPVVNKGTEAVEFYQ